MAIVAAASPPSPDTQSPAEPRAVFNVSAGSFSAATDKAVATPAVNTAGNPSTTAIIAVIFHFIRICLSAEYNHLPHHKAPWVKAKNRMELLPVLKMTAFGRNPPSIPLPPVSDERPPGSRGTGRLDAQHASATRPSLVTPNLLLFCSFALLLFCSFALLLFCSCRCPSLTPVGNPRNHTPPRPHAPTYTGHLRLQCRQPRSLLQGSPSGWLHRLNPRA